MKYFIDRKEYNRAVFEERLLHACMTDHSDYYAAWKDMKEGSTVYAGKTEETVHEYRIQKKYDWEKSNQVVYVLTYLVDTEDHCDVNCEGVFSTREDAMKEMQDQYDETILLYEQNEIESKSCTEYGAYIVSTDCPADSYTWNIDEVKLIIGCM